MWPSDAKMLTRPSSSVTSTHSRIKISIRLLVAVIRAGADGYLLKDTELEDLLAALHRTMFGRTSISPELFSLLAGALRAEALEQRRTQTELTEREQQILQLLAGGKSNKLIARELDIMDSTVKVHSRNLLKKCSFVRGWKPPCGPWGRREASRRADAATLKMPRCAHAEVLRNTEYMPIAPYLSSEIGMYMLEYMDCAIPARAGRPPPVRG